MSLAHQIAQPILEAAAGGATGEPSVPMIFALTCPDGVDANLDWTTPNYAIRVVDCWAVKTTGAGGAADDVTLQTSAGAPISSVLDLNIADTTIARTTLIDDAQHELSAGGTIRLRRLEGAADGSALVYVKATRT